MSDNVPAPLGSSEDRWLTIIERVLATPNLPIENLERILALRDRELQAAAQEDFNRSLAACQAEIKQIGRDKPNPAFRSRYSSLAAVDEEIRPVREKYGFGWLVSQAPAEGPGNVRYQGVISKGRIEKTVYLEADRAGLTGEGPRGGRMALTPVQSVGSITTYMRRYLLKMAFDLVEADDVDDDDGEGSRRSPSPPVRHAPRYADMPYDAQKETTVKAAQAIIGNGNGANGKGGTWLDRFEAGMDKAQTAEDWDRINARADVKAAEAQLTGADLDRFDAIRKRTAARIFPAPPAYDEQA